MNLNNYNNPLDSTITTPNMQYAQTLSYAQAHLLEPTGLTTTDLQRVLSSMLGGVIDEADIYFQNSQNESWVLEDGIIKTGSKRIDQGMGLRAIAQEKTGFAYANEIVLPALERSALAARGIAYSGQSGAIQAWHRAPTSNSPIKTLYTPDNPLSSLTVQDKINLLKQVESYAKKQDPRVTQVTVSLAGSFETILIMDTQGQYHADMRPLVRLNVQVLVADGQGKREAGSWGGGGRMGYSYFTNNNSAIALEYARLAVKQALVNLEAKAGPAGVMPVVLGSGWPGVLLHEAVGHGLEGDFNRKGTSVFANRIGEQVAARGCTVVDDGSLMHRRGSLTVDDEGVPSQRTVLIENGILKGYMQDKLNAKLMGTQSTANGRRQSYAHMTMPRMTNTFMLPGAHTPEEIIKSVKKGLYAVHFGGGSVDITSGNFVFSASEAYMIENGKITYPVKGATLIGNGPEVMHKIVMIGNDLALDSGVGICGKEGQSVPVGVGQPTLKVNELTVGGTQL